MEAVIVIIAALIVIVLLDAAYWMALCLARWAPSLALGVLAGWIAHRHGVDVLDALGLGALATLITKRVLLPIFLL